MDKDTPDWIDNARTFIATGRREYLQMAQDKCRDPEIADFLGRQDVAGGGLVPPEAGTPLSEKLRSEAREKEAAVVYLLSIRLLALMADQTEQFDKESYEGVLSICNQAVVLSRENELSDCEALFTETLGVAAAKQHNWDQARQLLQHSLKIYRNLVETTSEIYRPDVVKTSNSLGVVLHDLREFAAARHVFEEALEIRRELAASQQQVYQPDVAGILTNLGAVLRDQREFGAARNAFSEALEIYRRLVETNPQLYRPDMATALNNVGLVLHDLREFAAACNACEDALKIYRELIASQPQIYRPYVALTLNNLADILRKQWEFAAAQDAIEESIKEYRELAASQLQIYRSYMAATLISLGNVLREQREFGAARDALAEASEILRDLAASQPQTHRQYVAMALNNLGDVLEEMGENEQALEQSFTVIAVVEEEASVGQLYLAKGNASAAYQRVLVSQLENGEKADVFRTLAAMNEGSVRALADNREHSLAASQELLSKIRHDESREVVLLVASNLGDNCYALSVIHSDGMEYSIWEDDDVDALFGEVLSVFDNDDTREADVRHKKILRLGVRLWERLPGFVREALDPTQEHDVLIVGDTFCNAFCWELLCFGVGENDWLGLHRSLVRYGGITAEALSRLERRSFGDGKSQATVFCPWDIPDENGRRLQSAEEESKRVESRLRMLGYELCPGGKVIFSREANHPELMRVVGSSPSIIHYSGHGAIVGNDEVLVVWDGSQKERAFFGRKDIALAKQLQGDGERLFPHGLLIVLNSCMTGKTRSHGGQREDLASSFLREGAEAVIASALPVFDRMGMSFGQMLYDRKYHNESGMAYTFGNVRRALEKRYRGHRIWPAWSLLTYHGNPYARLPHL